jgi:GNAT superfamily N-acetyltransferase
VGRLKSLPPFVVGFALLVVGARCHDGLMTIEVRPASSFDDVATMVGPKRPESNVCWCLSYRIPSKENLALRGPEREERVRQLVRQDLPPGVLAYEGDEVVGWAAVHPRADTSFATNRKIPHVDDLEVWSLWCIRVRPGHRGTGIAHHLIDGAVEFARAHGAPAIEGYPVDNDGKKVDLTMAYVGTQKLFERAGFVKVADTESVINRFPRVLMRFDLR